MKRFTIAAAALLVCACSTPAPPDDTPAAADPGPSGTLSGRVVFTGTAPAPEMIRLDGDPKCVELAGGNQRPTEDVTLGDGQGLGNVFVYIRDGLPPRMYPVPSAPVVLDQQQCRYVPRVLGIQVGQPLAIRNSDPLLHNVRAESAINEPFDIGTPVQGVEVTRTFVTREVMVPVTCNVHAWMRAYVGVLEHPYFAVTDAGGRFSIDGIPPGTYTVEAWHERFGTQTQQITVAGNSTAEATFSYEGA